MKQPAQHPMHQMSGSSGLLWTLRGMFSGGRDVTLSPEDGIFEPAQDKMADVRKVETKAQPIRRRRAEWITPNKTYRIGGDLTDVYRKTIGVRLAIQA